MRVKLSQPLSIHWLAKICYLILCCILHARTLSNHWLVAAFVDHTRTHWSKTKVKCAWHTSLQHFNDPCMVNQRALYFESVLPRDVRISSLQVSIHMASTTENLFKLSIYLNSKLYSLYLEDSSLLRYYAVSNGKQLPIFCTIIALSLPGQRLYNLLVSYFIYMHARLGATRWCSWLRLCITSQQVAGSICNGVTGIFHWHNPSSCTMSIRLTQPLTEMGTRNSSCGIKTASA
jgi:hypothetical protein